MERAGEKVSDDSQQVKKLCVAGRLRCQSKHDGR